MWCGENRLTPGFYLSVQGSKGQCHVQGTGPTPVNLFQVPYTHTHKHKQRCRPSTSVTEDTGKAPALLSPPAPSFSTAEAGPRLPGAPTSPVPTPPAQVKSGEELSRGQGRQATPWISASGQQGTNPGPWPRLCPSALGTKSGQGRVSENTEHMKEGEMVLPQDLVSRGLGEASVRTLKMFLRPKTSAP